MRRSIRQPDGADQTRLFFPACGIKRIAKLKKRPVSAPGKVPFSLNTAVKRQGMGEPARARKISDMPGGKCMCRTGSLKMDLVQNNVAEPYAPDGHEAILLVEDNEAVRLSVRRLLASCGYRVHEAADGPDAINQFQAHGGAMALVILDVVLPTMCGADVYRELRRLRPDAKILFTSGYSSDAVLDMIPPDAGMYFIEKPLNPEEFLQTVRLALAR